MHPSLFEVIARDVIVVLINGLWQGLAIAALTWLVLRLFPRVNASTRYAAWTLALVAILVVPIATTLTHITYYTLPATNATTTNPIQSISSKTTAAKSAPESVAQTGATGGTVRSELKQGKASEAPSSLSSSLRLPKFPDVHVNAPLLLTTIFFTLWGLAALALVARLAVALLRLEGLKRDAMPLGIEYRDQLQQWQRMDPDRDVRICVTAGIEVPVAVGLFDAMVLLPRQLLNEFDAQEIDQISLHELAHLLRHDDWTNGLQRVITSLLFFNPAVWFIARQMDVEREVACDDYVLELTGAVRTYAFCLTKMAEKTSWPHQPLAAPGVFTTRKNISIRIERLLRSGRAIGSSIAPATAGAVAIGLLGGYFFASTLTPEIAFAMPSPPALPAAPAAPVARVTAPKKAVAPKIQMRLPQVSFAVPSVPVNVAKPHKAATQVAVVDQGAVKAVASAAKSAQAWAAVPALPAMPYVHVNFKTPTKIAWNGRGAGMSCTGCDFANQNLSGKNFSGSTFTGSDFSKANLQGANFNGASLSGADFQGADLRNASFVGANLTGANLDNAKLDGANFDNANLSGADLNPRSLSPSQIRAYLPHCRGCDLAGADLAGMDLSGVHLVGVDLSKANLRGANLSKATFSGVDFSGADLRGARTDGTEFIGCDFSGAQLGSP